jgi:hypothetical protein
MIPSRRDTECEHDRADEGSRRRRSRSARLAGQHFGFAVAAQRLVGCGQERGRASARAARRPAAKAIDIGHGLYIASSLNVSFTAAALVLRRALGPGDIALRLLDFVDSVLTVVFMLSSALSLKVSIASIVS